VPDAIFIEVTALFANFAVVMEPSAGVDDIPAVAIIGVSEFALSDFKFAIITPILSNHM
jgi:hypothetical protein